MTGQIDSLKTKLSFGGDFRFRIEQDWDSRKSDGSYRDDRTRLRYRARFGVTYEYKDWFSSGVRLRTGDPMKQQDPQLTLGEGFEEFGTLPIGFEKAYANFSHKWFSAWIGKNTFPFEKQNELFWSDNVFPEGVSLSGSFDLESRFIQTLRINTGHFIVSSKGRAIESDAYFRSIQFVTTHWQNRLKLFPSFYYFNEIPNIPDGNETFVMNFAVLHFGAKAGILEHPLLTAGVDYYHNFENYDNNLLLEEEFTNQKEGVVAGLNFGSLENLGDWKIGITYAYLERFAAVDFLAQNDWARWDYSTLGSNDGRLTNFRGVEIVGGYALNKNMNLIVKYYTVNQIIPLAIEKETGNRIRFDFNFSF